MTANGGTVIADPGEAVFAAPGEMAARCREIDWAATPLGPVERWSTSLRTTVGLVLSSRQPMFLWWGPKLVQFHNDAYRPSLGTGGRADRALGACGREFWTDIWPVIGPQIEQVMTTGVPVWHEDLYLPIERNGRLEDVWWTYSYSAVRDDDGRIAGTLVVCMETTERVLTERRLKESAATLEERTTAVERALAETALAESHLRDVFSQAPVGVAVLTGPSLVYEIANARYAESMGGGRPLIGVPVRTAFPEVAGQGYFELLDEVLATGTPVSLPESRVLLDRDRDGVVEEYFFDLRFEALRDPAGRPYAVVIIAAEVTEQVRARRRTELLQELTVALSATLSAEQVAAVMLERGLPAFGAAGGGVVLRIDRASDDTPAELQVLQMIGFEVDASVGRSRYPLRPGSPGTDAVLAGRPLLLGDRAAWEARYPGLWPTMEAGGFEAYGAIPLRFEERVIGVLTVYFVGPRTFADEDVALLSAFGEQCAQALERARLYTVAESARDDAERARAAAEEANRAKSAFLATMSHELRTPLNAIGGYAELIELGIRGAVTEEQRADLARIQASQRHLLGLINDVLNYAKLETGAVRYDLEAVPVDEALRAAQELVIPQARAKGLTLTVDAGAPAPRVRADAEKLRQILANLLSNAVKFTPAGGTIALCARAEGDAAGAAVRVRVRDTGIGIPADRLDAIFEPFVQVRSDLTRTAEGTGLGLAISRDLARGMGGDLTAESAPGAGSTFTLTLPAAR
ncbi:PAS domain-containing sensor histidine kinase [Roseisolibacter agri]|uniref:histidine kinase n=1 Tax=Roseisolibacter agri TaxID=2014610 RepID=A0AA37Q5F2_9BACT|nr:ATP-binding protein [Roseisolibacter agri]GLC26914.1 hypothetical protein rosag_34270 [Roseisolibacter agri]